MLYSATREGGGGGGGGGGEGRGGEGRGGAHRGLVDSLEHVIGEVSGWHGDRGPGDGLVAPFQVTVKSSCWGRILGRREEGMREGR